MLALLSRFWFSLRFALLTASVLLVLGLNQRAVSVLRLPVGKGETRFSRAAQGHGGEAKSTAGSHRCAGPLCGARWPWPGCRPPCPPCGCPALRRALAVPRLRAGVRAGEVFRARLLAVALSPQAP